MSEGILLSDDLYNESVHGSIFPLDGPDGNRFHPLAPNGSKGGAKADWSPSRSRDVTIWRDADDPGLEYARAVKIAATDREHLEARDFPFVCSPRMFDPFSPLGRSDAARALPLCGLDHLAAWSSAPLVVCEEGESAPVNKGGFLQSFIGSGGAKAPPCVTGLPGKPLMKTKGAASIAASPPRVYRSCRRRRLATK